MQPANPDASLNLEIHCCGGGNLPGAAPHQCLFPGRAVRFCGLSSVRCPLPSPALGVPSGLTGRPTALPGLTVRYSYSVRQYSAPNPLKIFQANTAPAVSSRKSRIAGSGQLPRKPPWGQTKGRSWQGKLGHARLTVGRLGPHTSSMAAPTPASGRSPL